MDIPVLNGLLYIILSGSPYIGEPNWKMHAIPWRRRRSIVYRMCDCTTFAMYEYSRICCLPLDSYTSSVTLIRSDYSIATMLYFIAGWLRLGAVSGGESSTSARSFGLSSGESRYDIHLQV